MAFTTPIPELIERNSNGLLGKHPSWERVRLGDVVTVQNGAAFKSEYFNTEGRGMPLLRIRDIVRGATETWYAGPYDEEYVVHPGDLVIGMDGDFNHALWAGPEALLNQRVCRLVFRSDAVQKSWVFHVLGGYLEAVNDATPSVTVKHLSSKTIADLLLPLPGIHEQDNIVARLEELLRHVADGQRYFEEALRGLDAYMTSLMHRKVAAERVVPLSDIADITSGLTKGRRTKAPVKDWPFLRAANLRDGYLDLQEIKTIGATDKEVERLRLQPGDVLLVEGSGSPDRLGQGWVWCGEIADCLHQNHVFRARPDQEKVLPEFLAWVIQSPAGKAYFRSVAKTTAGLTTVNKRQVSALPVPLPSLEDQARIGAVLASARESVRQTRIELKCQLTASASLVRGIQRDAREGALVTHERGTQTGTSQEFIGRIAEEKSRREGDARASRRNSVRPHSRSKS